MLTAGRSLLLQTVLEMPHIWRPICLSVKVQGIKLTIWLDIPNRNRQDLRVQPLTQHANGRTSFKRAWSSILQSGASRGMLS